MTKISALLCLATVCLGGAVSSARAGEAVDVQLVLAADISASMTTQELQLQRKGYVTAFLSRAVAAAIRSGLHRRIAVTYVEWGDRHEQIVVVPWTVLSDQRSIDGFAHRLAAAPVGHPGMHTALSSALLFSARLFRSNGLTSLRRKIDISGDGKSDDGPPLAEVRRTVISKSITINALCVAQNQLGPYAAMFGVTDADIYRYYRKNVIGGPGSFALAADRPGEFVPALVRKLVLEIALR